MSEADAVPLPREGEVFFDVRGEARCMRLSWYADSAIAVFSIWQGNRCTGTFRLPFKDLARMTQALQSGPGGQAETGHPGRGRPDQGYPEREAAASHGVVRAARREGAPAYGGARDGGLRGVVPPGQHSNGALRGVVPPGQHSDGGFRGAVPPPGLPYETSQRHDVSARYQEAGYHAAGYDTAGYNGAGGYDGPGYQGPEGTYRDSASDHDRGGVPGYGDAPWQSSTQAFPAEPRYSAEPRHPGYPADESYPATTGNSPNASYRAGASRPAEPAYPSGYTPGVGPEYEAMGPRPESPAYSGQVTGHWMAAPAMPQAGGDLESDWGSGGYPAVPAANTAPDPSRAATGYPRA